jgi:Na+/H+ antiporter NhaD/arsenite permease-like protein
MEIPTPPGNVSLPFQSGLYGGGGGQVLHRHCADGGTAPIYVQVLGTIVFVVVWPFIVLDMKWFPLGRPAAALVGAALMVITHVVTQNDVYDIQGLLGNMQTIFLLVGMMMLSYYYDREGLLRMVGLWIFGDRKSFKSILWKVCLMSALISAVVTNDANCLVITPLLLMEGQKQGRDRRELLPLCLGIATAANIGSAATIFGNPQNAFIASSAGVTLLEFFMSLLPAALIGTAVDILLLYLIFWKTVFEKYEKEPQAEREAIVPSAPRNYTMPGTLAEERESLALSYDRSHDPYLSSRIAAEREGMYSHEKGSGASESYQRLPRKVGRGISPYPRSKHGHLAVPEIHIGDEQQAIVENGGTKKTQEAAASTGGPETEGENNSSKYELVRVKSLKERTWRERIFIIWLGFITLLLVVLLAIPPPPAVSAEFNLGLIPMAAAILTMLADTIINKTYAYDCMLKIDWGVILMFMGLFVWLEGFQNTCYVELSFDMLAPYMNLYKFEGVLLFTVFVIVGSNLFSNVPLTILIVNRIDDLCGGEKCEGPLGGLLLAWISTVAGNFTLIGSVANLIVAEKARSAVDYRITFWNYLKFGAISTFVVLFGCLPIVYFLGRFA